MSRYNADARDLELLGLSSGEAAVYIVLVGKGRLGVQGMAELSGVPRSSLYPTLRSLADKGLVEGGAGYRGRYRAVPTEIALSSLIDRQRETLSERERLAKELIERLAFAGDGVEDPGEDVIEILRNRRVIADRYERLQLLAEREIKVLVKTPILGRGENPAQEAALRRGVRVRALYERAALEDEAIAPYVKHWIVTGEDARLYNGELPLKFALFDDRNVLMPLETPAEADSLTAVLIRHAALGAGLKMLFECLWENAAPVGSEVPLRTAKRVRRTG
jgi:sugar-specific transcriptional regulator TrmB